MRVLFVTSEAYPLSKTGGLADVSAALPAALRQAAIDVRLIMPAYPQALDHAPGLREITRLGDVLGCGETRLLESFLPGSGVPVWLVDCPRLYNRGGGLYQAETGADWEDNAQRYAALNVAAVAIGRGAAHWQPDLIHANDWHAGLIPLMLSQSVFRRPATVLTVHNLAYQGVFDAEEFDRLGLWPSAFQSMEFYGRISFLKAGIKHADAITTVSPTYAREILTPEFGCGMDGLLREKANRLTGILNGADYGIWDPRTDSHLEANYSPQFLAPKQACKRALQEECGLDVDAAAPLMGFMSRLAHQKMPDVMLDALPALLDAGMQFVLVGEGAYEYEARFRQMAENYPRQVAVRIGYEEPMAHRLIAGVDMLAHPARFEPCGLVPIYALRYGAVPIVRRIGGMADSVTDATPETMQQATATGFAFDEASVPDFLACARRAIGLFQQPLAWRKIQLTAMTQDFSWGRSAEAYSALYRSLVRTPALPVSAQVPAQLLA